MNTSVEPAVSVRESGSLDASEMRAAVIAGPREVEIRSMRVPEPGPGEVRVRMEGCGVCSSNLPVWQGRSWFSYPQSAGAPGHEGWGVVDKVGEGTEQWKRGDRVALLSYNAFAEYDVAPADSLVALPDALGDQPFPGEAFGCAINIFRRSGIEPGATVAILGIGFQGALLTSLASKSGARVFAISRRPWPLHLARRLGAEATVLLSEREHVKASIAELTDAQGCDVVIEATGAEEPLQIAGDLARTRGRLVIAGFHQDGPRRIDMQTWNWKGLDVINAHEREAAVYIDGIQRATQAVGHEMFNPELMLTHEFSLDRIGDAFQMLEARPEGFLKAWVRL